MRTDPPRAAERRPSDRSREPSPETTNGGSSPTATPQESATGARQLEIDFGGKATGADPTLEEQRCRALDAFRSLTGDTGTPAAPSDPDEEASRRLERALREDPARFQTESARLDQEVSRLRSTVLSDRPVLDERRKTRADFEALFSSIASAPDAGPAPTAPAGPEPSSPQASAPPAADAPSSESFSSGTLRPWDDWPAVSLDKLKEDPARDPLARDRTFEEDDPLLGGGVLYEDARERPGLDEPDDRLVGGRGDSDGIDGARDVRSLEPEIEYRDDRVSYEADRPSWQDGRGRGRSADPRVREPRGHGTGRPSGPGRFAESESSRRNRTVAGPSPRFPGRFPAGPAGDRAIVGRDLLPKIPGGRTGLVYLVEGSGPVSGSGSLRILYRHPPAASADSWRIPDRHVAMDGRLPDIGEDGDAGVGADEGGAPRPAAAEDAASDEDSGNRLEAASVVTPVPVDRYLTRRSRDPLDQKIAGVLQRLPRQSNVPARKGGKPERGRRKFRGKHPRVPSKLEQATTLVTEKAWRILLPWLVETGRFYCVPQGAFEAIPVVADGQGPLEFHLLLERIPRRGDYHLTCRFVRDQKILLYKSQILLVTEGEKGHLLRRSGKLSTVDFAGSAAWLRALRR